LQARKSELSNTNKLNPLKVAMHACPEVEQQLQLVEKSMFCPYYGEPEAIALTHTNIAVSV
jgi:hypothetical protein